MRAALPLRFGPAAGSIPRRRTRGAAEARLVDAGERERVEHVARVGYEGRVRRRMRRAAGPVESGDARPGARSSGPSGLAAGDVGTRGHRGHRDLNLAGSGGRGRRPGHGHVPERILAAEASRRPSDTSGRSSRTARASSGSATRATATAATAGGDLENSLGRGRWTSVVVSLIESSSSRAGCDVCATSAATALVPGLGLHRPEDARSFEPYARVRPVGPELDGALQDLLGAIGVAPAKERLAEPAVDVAVSRRLLARRDEHGLRVREAVRVDVHARHRQEDAHVRRVTLRRVLPHLGHEVARASAQRVAERHGHGGGRVVSPARDEHVDRFVHAVSQRRAPIVPLNAAKRRGRFRPGLERSLPGSRSRSRL